MLDVWDEACAWDVVYASDAACASDAAYASGGVCAARAWARSP